MKTILTLFLALSLPLALPAIADDDEKSVTMKDLPKVVRKAISRFITQNVAGASIVEIEVETEKGVQVYEFDLKLKDGSEMEVEMSAAGKILEVERDDDDDDDDKGRDD